MKRIAYIFTLLIGLVITSCDEHEALDLNVYPGFVLCDDHHAMSLEEFQSQTSRKAVGVIFAVANEDHPMLAVMLTEISCVQFSDTLGYIQETSGDIEKYDGFANTIALQNSYDMKTEHGSPLANAAFRYHQYGQSDFIPSVAEFQLLVQSLSVINPVIRSLGGTPVSTVGGKSTCWYWTSTEVMENQGNQAWLCSAANGAYIPSPKDEYYAARTICAINYMNYNPQK